MWVESLVFSERHLVGLSGCGVWGGGFLICWGGAPASSSISAVPSGNSLDLNQTETGKGCQREIGVWGWKELL